MPCGISFFGLSTGKMMEGNRMSSKDRNGKMTGAFLPHDLRRALEQEAKRRLTTKSTIIRQALAKELGLMESKAQQQG